MRPRTSKRRLATGALAFTAFAVTVAAAAAFAAAATLLAACAGNLDGSGDDGGGDTPDGGVGCTTFVAFEPASPVAGPSTQVRANAGVQDAPGVLDFVWTVTFQGAPVATSLAQADGSAILFPAAAPGVYAVQLEVRGAVSCPTAQAALNVAAPGANRTQLRLRVTPPPSAAVPAFEKVVTVNGGAGFTFGTLSLDPGVTVSSNVQGSASGVAAYLRLMPVAAREVAVETFAGGGGYFSARVLEQPHDVLVIPDVSGHAPRLVRDWVPSAQPISVGPGVTVTGTVRGPGSAPLAGAKVQLKIGIVPSTLGVTDAAGAFSLLAEPAPGAVIAVDVTPPADSGLPRLLAQSATLFSLGQPFEISYAALALRDLGGAVVRRQGAPVAGAKVVLVGNLVAAGSVTAGAGPASAAGLVQIAATAGGAGALPATLAPARALSAVIEAAPNDHAVAGIDLTASVPASIDAPPPVAVATQLLRPDGTPVAEAVLDATPVGALALAGVTSVVRARSGAGGQLSANLAAGGHYDLRIHDPALGRGAPLLAPDATAQTIAASYALRPALTAIGKLIAQGSPTPIGGAAVQLLCLVCTGLERSRPLAEGTSRPDGSFTLVVPDPGTN
jgi:hypothetical protein